MLNYLSLNIYQQLTYVFENIQLIIGVVGIIGNILVLIVFSRPSLSKYSYSFYCQVMTISDIGVLLFCIKNWSSYVLEANLDIVAPFFCSICQYLVYLFGGQSIFMLTLITADRMVTIVYSNRFTFLKKRWFQWMMVLIGLIYNVSINLLPLMNSHIIVIDPGTNSSAPIKMCILSNEMAIIQTWIILGNFFILNMFINNILNIKMVWFIVSSRRKIVRSLSNVNNSSGRDRKFAITSIGLNLTCMVLKLPLTIAFLTINQIVINFDELIAIQMIVITVSVLDSACSFFINFFVNSIFSREFLVLVGIRKANHLANTNSNIVSNLSANNKNNRKKQNNQSFLDLL